MELAEYLALRRRAKGLSLSDLARQTGVSRSHLSKIETGRVRDPGIATVVMITRALEIEIGHLVAACEWQHIETPSTAEVPTTE
jgi:transcriptional regulator with XRE-family HTH domain